jgi:acyl-CoA synthetase (AMP-forming)/AMP-acid ligase II
VLDAVAFGLPHRTLGEDLYAAVLLREGEAFDGAALRDYLLGRLQPNKVPRRILQVDEIPRVSGKKQRLGMAEKLGLGMANAGQR